MKISNKTKIKCVIGSFKGYPIFLIRIKKVNYYSFYDEFTSSRESLIERYPRIEKFILKLESRKWGTMKDVLDARYMFHKSKITSFKADMSHVIDAESMFLESKLETFRADMSNVSTAVQMFARSNIKKFKAYMHSDVNNESMFLDTVLENIKMKVCSTEEIIKGEDKW